MLWYLRISLSATVPGRYLRGFFCGTGSPAGKWGKLSLVATAALRRGV